jgi:pimeloyl-ACP methyl ester carboxylesterase
MPCLKPSSNSSFNLQAISNTTQAREEAVSIINTGGEGLVGVWHEPGSETSRRDAAIVMLHGWSGTRTGPHQMLTRAARTFAADGYRVFRFDFAGRGDSDGDTEAATLATMADDVRDVLQWCREEKQVSQVILVGLCSGCEVALAAATRNSCVSGLALWSAPVFAAGESSERKSRKRLHYAKEYARKLLRPSTYAKILGGGLDTKSIGKALSGGGGAENKNVEANVVGQLPPGWRAAALKRFEQWTSPLLLIYGTGDPTTEEALAWYRAQVQGRIEPQVHFVEGANHSYYGLAWEREVFAVTLDWLGRLTTAR